MNPIQFFQYITYIVVQTSGKQFVMKPGFWYDIDFLKNAISGNVLWLSKILLFKMEKRIQLGKPFLINVKIPAKVLSFTKGEKFTILKTKPKKKYTRKQGHRQLYTRIKLIYNN